MVEKQVVDDITKKIVKRWRKNYIQTLSQICKVEPEYIQRLKYVSFKHWDFRDGHKVKRHLLKYTHFCNICYFDLKNNIIVYLDSILKPIFVYIRFANSNEIFIVNRAFDYFDENIAVAIVDSADFYRRRLFEITSRNFHRKKAEFDDITLFKLNEPFKLENFNIAIIGSHGGGTKYRCDIHGYAVIRNYKQIITTPGITFEFEAYLSL